MSILKRTVKAFWNKRFYVEFEETLNKLSSNEDELVWGSMEDGGWELHNVYRSDGMYPELWLLHQQCKLDVREATKNGFKMEKSTIINYELYRTLQDKLIELTRIQRIMKYARNNFLLDSLGFDIDKSLVLVAINPNWCLNLEDGPLLVSDPQVLGLKRRTLLTEVFLTLEEVVDHTNQIRNLFKDIAETEPKFHTTKQYILFEEVYLDISSILNTDEQP